MAAPDSDCKQIPNLLSSFVDTFVDYTVSGLFLLPDPNPNPNTTPLRTHYPAPDRLVAIGDLHGDLPKTRLSFMLAGVVDSSDRWIGGATTVVQIGDVLDRGPDELKILYFLEKLRRDAARSGGDIISVLGNHEIMNVEADFRFVDQGGLHEFKAWSDWYSVGLRMKSLCQDLETTDSLFRGIPLSFRGVKDEYSAAFRSRIAALRPAGPIAARFLARNATAVVVGDSVFVHGGLLPEHVSYGLERINEEVRDWILKGGSSPSPNFCRGRNSLVWLRRFSDESEQKCDCSTLEHVLATIPGAKRMVMGHTIQRIGINGVCEDQAIRIDVGMSRGCGDGIPEVLEIISRERGSAQEIRILSANPMYYRPEVERKDGLGLLLPENVPTPVQVKA